MSDGMTPLSDTWTSRDLPFLRLVAQEIEDDGPGIDTRGIAPILDLDEHQAAAATRALDSGGFLTGVTFGLGSGYADIFGVTGKARTAVGFWPSPEVGYERLLAKLDELIEASTPEERTRLQRVRDAVVSSGGQLGVALAGAVLGNVMGV